MKSKVLAAACLVVTLASGTSSASLLTGGDFDTATLFGPNNYQIATNLNKWLMNQFSLQTPGPSGLAADKFAQHSTAGGGTDIRLVQFIDASALTAGTELRLEFDYIYAEAAGLDPKARVSLVGFSADRLYSMFGGAGVDGIAGGSDFAVAAPDALLNQVELPYGTSWSLDNILPATLAATYPYIGVVITAGCFSSTGGCNTLRGVDNISLTARASAAAPEPGTLALLGLGLAGLAAARRRRQ
jgi:hypothetical protein